MQEVSIAARSLDLYSPKFRLDELGNPGENIILKIPIMTQAQSITLFGNYSIGSKHAQISADLLSSFGGAVQVSTVSRYSLENAIVDINSALRGKSVGSGFEMVMNGNGLSVLLESRRFPASVKRMYAVGGRLYLLLQFLGKRIKIEFSRDQVRIYDSSRRELGGLTVVGRKLTLRRKFQHPELA